MKFSYQARTKEGEPQVGFVEAADRDAAAAILSGHDLFILKIEDAEKRGLFDWVGRWGTGVRRQDMVVFTRQFATLLEAQLPLEKALAMLRDQTTNATLREVTKEIANDVNAGLALSQAIGRHEGVFSGFFVSMVQSAEVTGRLEEVMGFLADHTEQEAVLVSRIRSALAYPAMLVGLFAIVVFVILTFVFPQIRPIFEESGIELPFYTRALLGLGAFLGSYWFAVVIALIVIGVIIADYLGTQEGRALKDDLKVRLPVLYRIFVPITITRFANASSLLIRGGVPLAQAMEIASATIDNVMYRDILHEVADGIRQGRLLSEAIAGYPEYFPPLVPQMIAVGEATGQLDAIFQRISNFYRREADAVTTGIVDLLQPILLVVIAIMVGFLFTSILLPLYQLTASIQ